MPAAEGVEHGEYRVDRGHHVALNNAERAEAVPLKRALEPCDVVLAEREVVDQVARRRSARRMSQSHLVLADSFDIKCVLLQGQKLIAKVTEFVVH